MNEKEIFEQGKKIYPINNDCDERLDDNYQIENWYETFYHLKKGKLYQRFVEITKKSCYSKFFLGLDYEYGVNGKKKDLNKAFKTYIDAAENNNDTFAMYRLYHLFKKDYLKFNKNYRDRILEKYYLFKCFSYLRYQEMERELNLCNRYDIKLEVIIHFEEEDINRNKFRKFIEFLKKYYSYYNIKKSDVEFIEIIINIKIIYEDEMDIYLEITKLSDLINNKENKDILEYEYKYAYVNKLLIDEEKEAIFKKLYDLKYYKSYIDYSLFLYSKNRNIEALKILSEARNNGILSAGFLYFDIYLDTYNNFDDLMIKAKNDFNKSCELYNLIQILIDDINIESIYSFYEFIFLRKICFKHYNLGNLINIYFYDYTKDIIDFLINITKEKDISNGKLLIQKYFGDDVNFKEYHLACGVAYFYGLKNILNRNIDKALYHIKIAYECGLSDSYKRFCYSYLYKISQILNKEKNLKKYSKNEQLVTDDDLKKMESKLFQYYFISIDSNIDNLSSSYFYYLSHLYNKKIGNPGDKIMEYICLNKAIGYINHSPGTGSIISFYRKYKSKKNLEKNKKECDEIFRNNASNKKKDNEGYGDNGDICPICFDKERTMMCLPCKHLLCEGCINKIKKCAICRKNILLRYKIK